jgi:hypothetical protein
MSSIPFRSFHNALRILRALDYHEVRFLKDAEWFAFRDNPYDFFISTSDLKAQWIWAAIQTRQPEGLREDKPPAAPEDSPDPLDDSGHFKEWHKP